ncbi:hypothetical protein BsWGS_14539 [Bradybaena similaris]
MLLRLISVTYRQLQVFTSSLAPCVRNSLHPVTHHYPAFMSTIIMSRHKSKSAPGEVKRKTRRDKSSGSQGRGSGHASVGTSIHSCSNQCTETLATPVASKVIAYTERIVTRSASLTHTVVPTQSECKDTSGGSLKSQLHGYQSVLAEARSSSVTNKPRAHHSEHSRTRSGSVKTKSCAHQSELSRSRSGLIENKTCGRQSELSQTRSGSRKSMDAKSGSIKNSICNFQIEAIKTEVDSNKNKKGTISVSPSQASISKDTPTKRKHRGSKDGINCASVRGNKAAKPGAGSLSNDNGSRAESVADKSPQLQEQEIMEEESSPSNRCQSKRRRCSYKTQPHSDKARHGGSMAASTPKKFIDKVEIVDLGQHGNSLRDVRHGQNVVKHGTRRRSEKTSSTAYWCGSEKTSSTAYRCGSEKTSSTAYRCGSEKTSSTAYRCGSEKTSSSAYKCSTEKTPSRVWSTSVAVRTSRVDSLQRGTLNRSKAVEIKRLEVDQGHTCATGTDALEEGEILSDSDVPGNMATNRVFIRSGSDMSTTEMLPPSGSDMSISSEDSSPEDAVPVIEHRQRNMFAAAGTVTVPPGSNLDPRAAVFIPRSLTSSALGLAPQPSKTDTSGIPKMSAYAYNQSWPRFSAEPHFTEHRRQLWPRYQAHAQFPQTRGLASHPVQGHIPGLGAHPFSAPEGSIFSSIISIWPYIAVLLQQQSQLGTGPSLGPTQPRIPGSNAWTADSTGPSLGPTRLDLPGYKVWAAGSTTISTEQTGQMVKRIHLYPAAEDTCPEITSTDRCWQEVRPADMEASSMELKVMSYNILSQDLMEKHMYLYSNCHEADLEWCNRGTALLTQIIAHNADIVCLQEVETDHWLEDIQDNLAQRGYEGVYKQQTGDSTHGCAILFKSSKLQLLKAVPVEFLKGGILDRHNIGLILLLQPCRPAYTGSVQKICVATTHLLFNPRRGDVKLAQLMVLLAEIDKHAYLGDQPDSGQCMQVGHKCCGVSDPSNLDQVKPAQSDRCENSQDIHKAAGAPGQSPAQNAASSGPPGYCPIILCGDFNSEPFCDLYKFITEGYLKYDDCISRLLCGQEEGRWAGTDRLVDRRLMPVSLDICETCQYLHILKERRHRAGVGGCQQLPRVNSGHVWHWMNFQSVYTHFLGQGYKNREISTHHNNSSCTVDYIFYTQTAAKRNLHTSTTDSENGDNLTADSENGDKKAAQTGDSRSDLQLADTNIVAGSLEHGSGTSASSVERGSGTSASSVERGSGTSASSVERGSGTSASSVERGSGTSASSVDSKNETAAGSADIDENREMYSADIDENREMYSADSQQAGDMCTQGLQLVSRYRLLRQVELTKYGFMPNSVFPSDHLCLIARFVLR